MIYFVAEDDYYYTSKGIQEIQEKYNIETPHFFPESEDIKKAVSSSKPNQCFMAPYLPSSIYKKFKSSAFFEIVRLENKHGFLTTGQKKAGISEAKAIEETLGVKIYEPNNTFDDYKGASVLRESVLVMEEKERHGLSVKGFMIAGIPGTGFF